MAQDPTLSRRTRPGIDGCATHAHGIDGQASVVCRSRSRPGGDLSLSSTSSSPVRSRSASETKEERWRARSRTSVATGDHATPSRRRVPLGLSHLVEMRRRDRLANQPTNHWLVALESRARRYATKRDASTAIDPVDTRRCANRW